jgi:hypothetical protein
MGAVWEVGPYGMNTYCAIGPDGIETLWTIGPNGMNTCNRHWERGWDAS